MIENPKRLFSFDEADHLTRIHLKLALEDAGFDVEENERTLDLVSGTENVKARRRRFRQ